MVKERGHLTRVLRARMLRHVELVNFKPAVEAFNNTARPGLITRSLGDLFMAMLNPAFCRRDRLALPFWRELVRCHQIFERFHIHHALVRRPAEVAHLIAFDDVNETVKEVAGHVGIDIHKFRLITLLARGEVFEIVVADADSVQVITIVAVGAAGVQALEMPEVKASGPRREVNRTGRVAAGAMSVFERAADVTLAVGTIQQSPAVGVGYSAVSSVAPGVKVERSRILLLPASVVTDTGRTSASCCHSVSSWSVVTAGGSSGSSLPHSIRAPLLCVPQATNC